MRAPLLSAARSARLARILDGGETLRLQYPREDLGFVYHSPAAAVCRDQPAAEGDAAAGGLGSGTRDGRSMASGSKEAPGGGNAAPSQPRSTAWSAGVVQGRDAPYVPTTVPGARLPHVAVTVRSSGECSL